MEKAGTGFPAFCGELVFGVEADFVTFGVKEMGDEAKANIGGWQYDLAASSFYTAEDGIQLMVGVEVNN